MADRHLIRGFGAGERRMERRRAQANLAREEASASTHAEAETMHVQHMGGIYSEENLIRDRLVNRLREEVAVSEQQDRQQREVLEHHRHELQVLQHQAEHVAGNIVAAKAETIMCEAETSRLKTELLQQGDKLEATVVEMRAERSEKRLLSNELAEALARLSAHLHPELMEQSAEARDGLSENVAAAGSQVKREAEISVEVFQQSFAGSHWDPNR